MHKSLCEDCRFLGKNCPLTVIENDYEGNVKKCLGYKTKNVIKNIFIMVKKNETNI